MNPSTKNDNYESDVMEIYTAINDLCILFSKNKQAYYIIDALATVLCTGLNFTGIPMEVCSEMNLREISQLAQSARELGRKNGSTSN